MARKKIKISKYTLYIFLLIVPLYKPAEEAMAKIVGASAASVYMKFLTMWDFISIMMVIYFIVHCAIKKSLSPYSILLISLSIVFGIATSREFSVDIGTTIRTLGKFLIVPITFNYFKKDKLYNCIEAFYIYLTLIMFLNSTSIYIYYPGGMYRANYYLFALDNVGFMYSIHGMFVGMVYYLVKKNKIPLRFYVIYSYILLAYIYARGGTAILISIGIAAMIIFYKNDKFKMITYKRTLIICGVLFVLISLVQRVGIITDISFLLGKGAGFNGRTTIWMAMFKAFPKHPFIGFGISPEVTQYYIGSGGSYWLSTIGHMHNIIFEFLFKSGSIGVALFLSILLLPIRFYDKKQNSVLHTLICVEVVLLWLTCMFEYRINTYTFWIQIILVYEIDILEELCIRRSRYGKLSHKKD